MLLQKTGVAALTTIMVYATMVYLAQGSLIYNQDGSLIFNFFMLVELGLAFLFLLSVFWVHTKISSFIHSIASRKLHPLLRTFLEAMLVVVSSLLLVSLINYLPLFLLYPEIEPPPGRLRTGYIVSTIISLFFYYFVERERSRKQLQAELLHSAQLQKENFQAQLQSLKNQVNPHFLFNSLNVLGSLIQTNQEKATEFVRRLSDVYRALLDHSHEQLLPLKKEKELVEAYIYLLNTRFGDTIRFRLAIRDEDLSLQLPPGSLQMLIENAVKHNGSTVRKPLIIQIYTEGSWLVVRNNLQARQEKVQSTKTGLNNIRKRYQYLAEEAVSIEETSDEFVVKLPLLKVEAYEGSTY